MHANDGDFGILVLVASLALLRQTLHEWLKETRWQNVAYLCVCSDPSVQTDADDLVVRQSDLDFPVTTTSNVAGQFLWEGAARSAPTTKIVFSTYHCADVAYDVCKRDKEGDAVLAYSMDNPPCTVRSRLQWIARRKMRT